MSTEKQQEAEFRATPLGNAITELEGSIEGHLVEMFKALGIETKAKTKELEVAMSNFIGASHAAGAIQRLVWQEMDHQAKAREAVNTKAVEKAQKKELKKEETKKNRPRGKTSMNKVN